MKTLHSTALNEPQSNPFHAADRTEIVVPGLGPSLNKMLRQHHTTKTRQRNQWQLMFNPHKGRHTGRVRLEIYRYSLGRAMDQDNLRGSYKGMVDALVRSGVINNDSPDVIAESHYEHIKCMHPSGQKTVIVIKDHAHEKAT